MYWLSCRKHINTMHIYILNLLFYLLCLQNVYGYECCFSFPAVPRVRLEAVHMTGVEEMSTQDIFGYYKEYPPAHIEWIDDASCMSGVSCDTSPAICNFQ